MRISDWSSDVCSSDLLNSRRGQIQGTDSRGIAQVVEAIVPLANMFGYVNQLRSFSQGRASYSMQFSHYEEVPTNVAEEVKAKMARSEERRVGTECGSKCRCWWSPYNKKQKKNK